MRAVRESESETFRALLTDAEIAEQLRPLNIWRHPTALEVCRLLVKFPELPTSIIRIALGFKSHSPHKFLSEALQEGLISRKKTKFKLTSAWIYTLTKKGKKEYLSQLLKSKTARKR